VKTNHREILLYYNPDSSGDRKTVAHAQSLSPHIKAFAYRSAPSTGMSWQFILSSLGIDPKDLLNKAHPYYRTHIKGRDFDGESWIKVIKYNPDVLKAPIAVRGQKAIVCLSPTDILRLI